MPPPASCPATTVRYQRIRHSLLADIITEMTDRLGQCQCKYFWSTRDNNSMLLFGTSHPIALERYGVFFKIDAPCGVPSGNFDITTCNVTWRRLKSTMNADKSLDLSIMPALRISDLRALCKARGIGHRATAKKEDLEKELILYEEDRVEKDIVSSKGEPREV
ncbi:hypothetical protein NDU88_005903 [Pleurodeles waltl]|uniref:SAP domain-containing protein n=1 Tax=Pleurodeles waltl TaxID=8319 RepID=A0AAV7WZW9_PLEWA|nr:hypothetical protein NDU88_005903 [Pleurodeles waltl]